MDNVDLIDLFDVQVTVNHTVIALVDEQTHADRVTNAILEEKDSYWSRGEWHRYTRNTGGR